MRPNLPESMAPLFKTYLELLDRWNKIHALTALAPEDRSEELLLDSAVLIPFLDHLQSGQRIIDFGTGMGIPSLVLAAARPDLEVVALDKSKKKIAFLTQASLELGLTNLKPVAARAEDLPPAHAHLGTAKAVGSLSLLLGWWKRHGQPGAPMLALKGPEWQQEPLPEEWTIEVQPYCLPHRGERFVLSIHEKGSR